MVFLLYEGRSFRKADPVIPGRQHGVFIAVALSLAGCSAVQTAMQYDGTATRVAMPDDTYRIFEHPNQDRIMTTPSLGKGIGFGLAKGLTLGVADIMTPEQLHGAAARKHLDATGRGHCVITRGYLIAQPQYEFYFNCESSGQD